MRTYIHLSIPSHVPWAAGMLAPALLNDAHTGIPPFLELPPGRKAEAIVTLVGLECSAPKIQAVLCCSS